MQRIGPSSMLLLLLLLGIQLKFSAHVQFKFTFDVRLQPSIYTENKQLCLYIFITNIIEYYQYFGIFRNLRHQIEAVLRFCSSKIIQQKCGMSCVLGLFYDFTISLQCYLNFYKDYFFSTLLKSFSHKCISYNNFCNKHLLQKIFCEGKNTLGVFLHL